MKNAGSFHRNHHFPMVFPWLSHDLLMLVYQRVILLMPWRQVSLRRSIGPSLALCAQRVGDQCDLKATGSYGKPMVNHGITMG